VTAIKWGACPLPSGARVFPLASLTPPSLAIVLYLYRLVSAGGGVVVILAGIGVCTRRVRRGPLGVPDRTTYKPLGPSLDPYKHKSHK